MLKNYHTHTFRCRHAAPDERAYIESAIKGGIKVLGFADHVPMPPFAEPAYYSGFRMQREELPDYVETLLKLKEEYKKDIKILIGFEAEYYPAMFEEMLKLLSPYPYDYLILGQHFLGDEVGEKPCSAPTDDPSRLARYVTQVCEGMSTGAYSYLAHPDILHFEGDDAVYREQMSKICETALRLDIPLECNLLGLREGRYYPGDRFFRLAAEYGCKVILGCDAHSAAPLSNAENIQQGYDLLARCGVTNIVEDIRLRA